MKKTECVLVKGRQMSAKGQQCLKGHSFLIFRKVQSPKGIGFIKWETTFFIEKTRPALVKARSLYFIMAACQLYPGRLVIEIFFEKSQSLRISGCGTTSE